MYRPITDRLRELGAECSVEYGLSDYIVRAYLRDGSFLVISPPQEPATRHPAQLPNSWVVTRYHADNPDLHEVVYDSEHQGPDARHAGTIAPLMHAVERCTAWPGTHARSAVSARPVTARASSPAAAHHSAVLRSDGGLAKPPPSPAVRQPLSPGR
ncbi:hypothetical protein GCM10018771_39520 [Streptomyces cellulosae]|nr:hypothetical protein GCM10018771_39520 [Streptomyces cellulosae]